MNVYLLQHDNEFPMVSCEYDVLRRCIDALSQANMIADHWIVPTFRVVDDAHVYRGLARPLGDHPYCSAWTKVVSRRFRSAVDALCSETIEWLPVHITGPRVEDEYFALHMINRRPALDLEASVVDRSDDRVSAVKKYVLVPAAMRGTTIFGLSNGHGHETLLTDEAVTVLTAAGVIGVRFLAIWSDERDCGYAPPYRAPGVKESECKYPDPGVVRDWSDRRLIDYWVDVLIELVKKDGRSFVDSLADVPQSLRDAYAAWEAWAQVGNGGFEQYFFNDGVEAANDAVQAFQRMGAPEAAAVVHAAIAIFRRQENQFENARTDADARLKDEQQEQTWEAFASLYAQGNFDDLVKSGFEVICKAIHVQWADFVRAHADDLRAIDKKRL